MSTFQERLRGKSPCPIERRFRWAQTWRSGIGATVDGQARARDVGGFRPGHERHQRSNLIHMPIAFERCVGDLGCCPIARRGIQIRIDGTRLNIVDRDARLPISRDKPCVNILTAPFVAP
jgi:hypothetical protein